MLRRCVAVIVCTATCGPHSSANAEEAGWDTLFNGTSLDGWHVSAKTGHSGTSKNTSGGRWVVEDGKAYQAMIDYHSGGNLMGIYGEGLGGKPHIRNDSFKNTVTEIDVKPTGDPKVPFPILPDAWPSFWRDGQWNEFRARIVGGQTPTITTWINGVKISEWTEARHPARGKIALQVHGGGSPADYDGQCVRYRGIRVKEL